MGNNCCAPGPEDAEANGGSPQARRSVAPSPARAPASGTANSTLSFDLVLSDLNKAEELAYGSAFAGFAPSTAGGLGTDCEKLREFVATNCCVPYEELDMALLKAASGNGDLKISLSDFLTLMRDNAIHEGLVIERFMSLAGEGSPSVSASDCRTGLYMIKDELGAAGSAVGDGRWEAVFDVVMSSAAPTVELESWTTYCKQVARIARVTHVAGI